MKTSIVAILGLAASAVAQFAPNSSTVSYTTSYWTECSGTTIGTGLRTGTADPTYTADPTGIADPTLTSLPPDVTQTATDIATQTYCPRCLHTTVYSTAYAIFCPTGVTTLTYVITATTSGVATPTWATGSTDVPPGFTTQVAVCTVCGPETITQVMTYPATSVPYQPGMPGAPTPAPAPPAGPGGNGTPAGPGGNGTPAGPGGNGTPAGPGGNGPNVAPGSGGYAAPSSGLGNNPAFVGAATTVTFGGVPVLVALAAFLL